MKTLTGRCFCGSLIYELNDKVISSSVCHCSGCRKASSSPAVAWITLDLNSFKIIKGELSKIRAKNNEYGACDKECGGERGFCSKCGSHITFEADDRKTKIDITTLSLDNPENFPPTKDYATNEMLGWVPEFSHK